MGFYICIYIISTDSPFLDHRIAHVSPRSESPLHLTGIFSRLLRIHGRNYTGPSHMHSPRTVAEIPPARMSRYDVWATRFDDGLSQTVVGN